jgi:apolipoprotein N-acyltransferase
MAVFPQFIQFIDISGPHGITVWLILVNVLIFEAIVSFRKKGRMAIFGAAALIIACAPALYSLQIWKGAGATSDLKISMVQPNIPLEKKLNPEYAPENMTTMLNITKEAVKQKPDLLIWPETAFPFPVQHWIDKAEKPSIPEISALAQYSSTPILIGAEYVRIKKKEDYDVYNAALLMDSHGNVPDYYGKIYLVPFTEGIPFKNIFGIKKLARKGILAKFGGFTPGEKSTVFEIEKRKSRSEQPLSGSEGQNKVRFGVVICYEGLYPELSRKLMRGGADFLVCITNDSWFGDTLFTIWHASSLRLRAIENRASIVRCANTGISSFYDPAGRMYQSTEPFTKAIVSGFISMRSGQTLYTKYGDLLVYISYAFFLAFALFCAFKPKKK